MHCNLELLKGSQLSMTFVRLFGSRCCNNGSVDSEVSAIREKCSAIGPLKTNPLCSKVDVSVKCQVSIRDILYLDDRVWGPEWLSLSGSASIELRHTT